MDPSEKIVLSDGTTFNASDFEHDKRDEQGNPKPLGEGQFAEVYRVRYTKKVSDADPAILKRCTTEMIDGQPVRFLAIKVPKNPPRLENGKIDEKHYQYVKFKEEQQVAENLSRPYLEKNQSAPFNMNTGGEIVNADGIHTPIIISQLESYKVENNKPVSSNLEDFIKDKELKKEFGKDEDILTVSLLASAHNSLTNGLHKEKALHGDYDLRNIFVAHNEETSKNGKVISYTAKAADFGFVKSLIDDNPLVKQIMDPSIDSKEKLLHAMFLHYEIENKLGHTKNIEVLRSISGSIENHAGSVKELKDFFYTEMKKAISDGSYVEPINENLDENQKVPLEILSFERAEHIPIDEKSDLHSFKIAMLKAATSQMNTYHESVLTVGTVAFNNPLVQQVLRPHFINSKDDLIKAINKYIELQPKDENKKILTNIRNYLQEQTGNIEQLKQVFFTEMEGAITNHFYIEEPEMHLRTLMEKGYTEALLIADKNGRSTPAVEDYRLAGDTINAKVTKASFDNAVEVSKNPELGVANNRDGVDVDGSKVVGSYLPSFQEYFSESRTPENDAVAFNKSISSFIDKKFKELLANVNTDHDISGLLLSINRLMAITIDKSLLSENDLKIRDVCDKLCKFSLDEKEIEKYRNEIIFKIQEAQKAFGIPILKPEEVKISVPKAEAVKPVEAKLEAVKLEEAKPAPKEEQVMPKPAPVIEKEPARTIELQHNKLIAEMASGKISADKYISSVNSTANSIIGIDKELFEKIDVNEFFNPKSQPTINTFIRNFDRLSKFIVEDILSYQNVKERSLCFEFWINVAERCLHHPELNSQNSAMAILSALAHSSVARLKTANENLSDEAKTKFDNIRKELNTTGGFKDLRNYLKENPVSIPFIGFYLGDFTLTEQGNELVENVSLQGHAPSYQAGKMIRDNMEIVKAIPFNHSIDPQLKDGISTAQISFWENNDGVLSFNNDQPQLKFLLENLHFVEELQKDIGILKNKIDELDLLDILKLSKEELDKRKAELEKKIQEIKSDKNVDPKEAETKISKIQKEITEIPNKINAVRIVSDLKKASQILDGLDLYTLKLGKEELDKRKAELEKKIQDIKGDKKVDSKEAENKISEIQKEITEIQNKINKIDKSTDTKRQISDLEDRINAITKPKTPQLPEKKSDIPAALKSAETSFMDKVLQEISLLREKRGMVYEKSDTNKLLSGTIYPSMQEERNQEKKPQKPENIVITYQDNFNVTSESAKQLFRSDGGIHIINISPEQKTEAVLLLTRENDGKFFTEPEFKLKTPVKTYRPPNDEENELIKQGKLSIPLKGIEEITSYKTEYKSEAQMSEEEKKGLTLQQRELADKVRINRIEMAVEFLLEANDPKALIEFLSKTSSKDPSKTIHDELDEKLKKRIEDNVHFVHHVRNRFFTRKEEVQHGKTIAVFVADQLMNKLEGKPSETIFATKPTTGGTKIPSETGDEIYVVSPNAHETNLGVNVSKQELEELKKNQRALQVKEYELSKNPQATQKDAAEIGKLKREIKKTVDKINNSVLVKSTHDKGFLHHLENNASLTLNHGHFGRPGTPYYELPRSAIVTEAYARQLEEQASIPLGPTIDEAIANVAKFYGVQPMLEFAEYVGMDVKAYQARAKKGENTNDIKKDLMQDTKSFLTTKMQLRQDSLKELALNIRLSKSMEEGKDISELIRKNPLFFLKGEFHFYGKNQSTRILGRSLKNLGKQKNLNRELNEKISLNDPTIKQIISNSVVTHDPSVIEHILANKRLRETVTDHPELQDQYNWILTRLSDDLSKCSYGLTEKAGKNQDALLELRNNAVKDLGNKIANEILSEKSISNRTLIMERWVKLLEKANEKGDIVISQAIAHAFRKTPVKDLKKTIDGLSPESKATFLSAGPEQITVEALKDFEKKKPASVKAINDISVFKAMTETPKQIPSMAAKTIEPHSILSRPSDVLKDKKVLGVIRPVAKGTTFQEAAKAAPPKVSLAKKSFFQRFHFPSFRRKKVAESKAALTSMVAVGDQILTPSSPPPLQEQAKPADVKLDTKPANAEQPISDPEKQQYTKHVEALRVMEKSLEATLLALEQYMIAEKIPIPAQPKNDPNYPSKMQVRS